MGVICLQIVGDLHRGVRAIVLVYWGGLGVELFPVSGLKTSPFVL